MDRRIFGLENEYGVTCTFRGQRRLSPDEVARYLFRRVVSWGRSSNVFLENGARLYLDVGSHPEYATPECDSVTELITHDNAGERILEGLLASAEQRLREEGIRGVIYLFKNNTDSAGNSYGCHENYLVSRYGEFQRLADVLIPFFVSRQILCGAGKVLATPRGAVYCIAQRAEHIWEGVSSATTRSRPIINTRDEHHADAERYRRLHVIVGDSNMSEWSAFLKVGATDLVLAMVEEATVLRDLTLENPIRAIREISHDMSCRRKVRLANGREASALEIQREYFEKAARFVDRRDAGETAKRVVDMWGHVLDALDEVSETARVPAGEQASGAEVAELFERIRSEEPDARIWKGVREARRGQRSKLSDTRYIHKDGRQVWLSWLGAWSEPAKRFFFVGRDMTESRLAQETLRESEQLARGIIDTALDAFVQTDENGFVLDWSPQAEVLTGWTRAETVGERLVELVFPEPLRVAHRQRIAQFLSEVAGGATGMRYEPPFPYITEYGERGPNRSSSSNEPSSIEP